MDTELLGIAAILVVAGWVALRIQEFRRSKTEPVVVTLTECDERKET